MRSLGLALDPTRVLVSWFYDFVRESVDRLWYKSFVKWFKD